MANLPTLGEVAYNEYQSSRGWPNGSPVFELLTDIERQEWEQVAFATAKEHIGRLEVLDLVKLALFMAGERRDANRPNATGRFWAIVCTDLEHAYAYLWTWLK